MDSYERKEVLGLEGSNEQMNHLVRKAIRGNAEAYGQLIEYYKEYLYKTAFLLVNNQEQALDLVGETILKGFQFVHKVKKPEYFKTWLTKILINAAHDCYRKYPPNKIPQFAQTIPCIAGNDLL